MIRGCQGMKDDHGSGSVVAASLLIVLLHLAGCGSAPPLPAPTARVSQPRPSAVTRMPAAGDADGDGIPDADEERLAQRFAPIVYHAPTDPYRPTNVDDFLAATSLGYYDASCGRRRTNYGVVEAQTLGRHVSPETCNRDGAVSSGGTLSLTKRRTFYLADLPAAAQRGSAASERWTTYYHAYPNDRGGVTLQFWRLYAQRTRSLAGVSVSGNGGDWQGLHVVLDGSQRPAEVRLLGDEHLDTYRWEQTTREGDHVIVFADRGSHATLLRGSQHGIRHETWTSPWGGTVRWPDGKVTATGPLVNLGEKTRPLQPFIQYSGLWGDDGIWSPAYHAIDRGADRFITVWCAGHATPGLSADGAMECYPTATTP
jgi:predicted small lipoprotein YifL